MENIFQNVFTMDAWIQSVAWNESGLRDLGVACVMERQQGRPVSTNDHRWMLQLVFESVAKKKYQVMIDTYEFIPDRLKNAQAFPKTVNYLWV